jgi:hypothetical protein
MPSLLEEMRGKENTVHPIESKAGGSRKCKERSLEKHVLRMAFG